VVSGCGSDAAYSVAGRAAGSSRFALGMGVANGVTAVARFDGGGAGTRVGGGAGARVGAATRVVCTVGTASGLATGVGRFGAAANVGGASKRMASAATITA
jgi:hypothetical protein